MTKIAREMLEEAKANYNAETGEGAGYLMEAYLFYLEEKMLSFVINEKDVMKLAIDRIIELMEIKKDERKF